MPTCAPLRSSGGRAVTDTLSIADDTPKAEPPMLMSVWLATEGGRKCPQCGRYAKREELGSLSYFFVDANGDRGHVSMYGHVAGFGCNKAKP